MMDLISPFISLASYPGSSTSLGMRLVFLFFFSGPFVGEGEFCSLKVFLLKIFLLKYIMIIVVVLDVCLALFSGLPTV